MDQELLKILEVREKEMEQNLLQKEKAFGYLYKEHHKEIKATIKKRDEELESALNYREKLWIESLDMVNANMIKMYQAQGDFKKALNCIKVRQNELIRKLLSCKSGISSAKETGQLRHHNPQSMTSLPPMLVINMN